MGGCGGGGSQQDGIHSVEYQLVNTPQLTISKPVTNVVSGANKVGCLSLSVGS